jgi:hypothetical protein
MHAIIPRRSVGSGLVGQVSPPRLLDTCRDSAVTPVGCALPTRTWWASAVCVPKCALAGWDASRSRAGNAATLPIRPMTLPSAVCFTHPT